RRKLQQPAGQQLCLSTVRMRSTVRQVRQQLHLPPEESDLLVESPDCRLEHHILSVMSELSSLETEAQILSQSF
ncbi:hypothetical protein NPIL_261011, partial [Nephila pilipes]